MYLIVCQSGRKDNSFLETKNITLNLFIGSSKGFNTPRLAFDI